MASRLPQHVGDLALVLTPSYRVRFATVTPSSGVAIAEPSPARRPAPGSASHARSSAKSTRIIYAGVVVRDLLYRGHRKLCGVHKPGSLHDNLNETLSAGLFDQEEEQVDFRTLGLVYAA